MNDTATLSRLFSGIQQDLDVVEQTFQERASSGLDLLNLASAHALSSPGKRLRTALTLLSGKLGDYLFEKLLLVSVAFEMVHLATLIHDDIIDHADTRRGIPTVNARWGEGVAILLGDYLFARTAGIIADLNDTRVIRLFSETVATVCEGTILETLSAGQLDISFDAYLERISRKTACLMAACCKGGATVCGGTDAQIALMEQYGHNLGMAFQIVDDVLDYSATADVIGKPAGNDLRQGLITLPLIYALESPQNGYLEKVQRVIRKPEEHSGDADEIIAWVAAGPSIPASLDLARHYAARARAVLSEF